MLNNNYNPQILRYFKIIFGYVIRYIAYNFLATAVALTIGAIMVIAITLTDGNLDFSFLKYIFQITFFTPKSDLDSFSLNLDDIMVMFSRLALYFLIVGEILRYIVKKYLNTSLKIKMRFKFLGAFIVLTLLYAVLLYVIPMMKMAGGGDSQEFYGVFIIFYFINLAALCMYFICNFLADKFSDFNLERVSKSLKKSLKP